MNETFQNHHFDDEEVAEAVEIEPSDKSMSENQDPNSHSPDPFAGAHGLFQIRSAASLCAPSSVHPHISPI